VFTAVVSDYLCYSAASIAERRRLADLINAMREMAKRQ